jgi:hypothetical protein
MALRLSEGLGLAWIREGIADVRVAPCGEFTPKVPGSRQRFQERPLEGSLRLLLALLAKLSGQQRVAPSRALWLLRRATAYSYTRDPRALGEDGSQGNRAFLGAGG